MLTFTTPTALPIEAATTMGVSVKDSESSIGKFGTGLKYAIAGILRLGGEITVWVDGERYDFEAHDAIIRGRRFRIVHCNGAPCGFTTDLGKHWQPWQIFRELASNALDEGGSWSHEEPLPDQGRTVITVACREVEDADREERVFLSRDRQPLLRSSNGATIYAGASPHYYFRGIRAGSFPEVAPVTVNVDQGTLSEDRLLDLSTVQLEMAWAFRSATEWDEGLMLSVLSQDDPGDFWVRNIPSHCLHGASLPEPMMQFMLARPKWVTNPVFKAVLDRRRRSTGSGLWADVEMTDQHRRLLALGEALCLEVGVDPIPRDKVHFTRDLDDQALAVTASDTRDVWFSTKLVMMGRDEFLSGYLEEALHAMTGFGDCTRELQNALLAIIVGIAQRSGAVREAA